MRKPPRRSAAAKAPRKTKSPARSKAPARRPLSAARAEGDSREALHLELISRRYEESERAWQRMTAPPEGDETWTAVEEQLARGPGDQDRRWKYFSK